MILCPQHYNAHLLLLITFGGNAKPPVVEKKQVKKGEKRTKRVKHFYMVLIRKHCWFSYKER
jgi:hypothetical protein